MAVVFGMLYLCLVAAAASPMCDFEKTEQHALYGHNSWVFKDVSLDQCKAECLAIEECLSFDYNDYKDSCFLSEQTKTSSPELFGKHMEMDYFEKVCRTDVTPSTVTPQPSPECASFTCPNEKCIVNSWVCDGDNDCGDNADEQNCPEPTIPPCSGFTCPSGKCIQNAWVCDGDNDCGDNEDEKNCPEPTTPPCDGFMCPSGKCIKSSWACDGDNDCGDYEDEQGCPCDGKKCPSGKCIPISYVCDGDDDCGDFDDEKYCTGPTAPPFCTEYTCLNGGRCINYSQVCDGRNDCGDNGDEAACDMK